MWNIVVFFVFLQNVPCYQFFEDSDEAYVRVDEEYQEYAVPTQCHEYCTEETREKRQYSPGRSRVIEAMLKAPTLTLSSDQPDLFYVLRDHYELPEGM